MTFVLSNARITRSVACLYIFGSLVGCAPTPSQLPATTTAPPPASPTPASTPSATTGPVTAAPTLTPIPLATLPPKPTLTPDPRPPLDTPAWFDDATMYQIFVRSFRDTNGDGIGDLKGIQQQLDYVQSLGVNTIWLTPHYPSTTYHGYDVVDYAAVNPQFGTLDDFKALVADMNKRGMRVFVDFVANHSSNGHPFFKDAYKNPSSPYTSWYRFKDANNETYDSFFGVANLPEWNHDNPDVDKYLIDAAMFWLDLGVDGLRCDYVLNVPKSFWQRLRETVKAKHPEAVLLGEAWDINPTVLKRNFERGFDALFDFPWYLTLSGGPETNGGGVLNGKDPVGVLAGTWGLMQQTYPPNAQLVRFPSNHDTNRIASAAEGDERRMRLAAAAALLTPGVPIMYYGEEIGMRGVKGAGPVYDEFRREPMDWYGSETGTGMTTWFKPDNRNNKPNDGISVEEQAPNEGSLLNYYRVLSKLRAKHPALRGEQFQMMQGVPGCDACVGMWRWPDEGAGESSGEVIAMFFNFSGAEHEINFNASESPVPLGTNVSYIAGQSASMSGLVIEPWGMIAMQWQ